MMYVVDFDAHTADLRRAFPDYWFGAVSSKSGQRVYQSMGADNTQFFRVVYHEVSPGVYTVESIKSYTGTDWVYRHGMALGHLFGFYMEHGRAPVLDVPALITRVTAEHTAHMREKLEWRSQHVRYVVDRRTGLPRVKSRPRLVDNWCPRFMSALAQELAKEGLC